MSISILDEIVQYNLHNPIYPGKKPTDPMPTANIPSLTETLDEQFSLIAEYKKQTPAGKVLTEEFIGNVVHEYIDAGARAVSVLADNKYFNGNHAELFTLNWTTVPRLCKDIVVSERQIDFAKWSGASAVLLIAGTQEQSRMAELFGYANHKDIEVLYEVHSEDDVEEALDLGADVIGVNNRDLRAQEYQKPGISQSLYLGKVFETELADKTVVSLSGIDSREDVIQIQDAGFDGILVGTSLLQSSDRKAKICELLGKQF